MDVYNNIFTDPHSGHEVLLTTPAYPTGKDEVIGVIYHPRKTDLPVPWHSNCPHCIAGRQSKLSIQLKREVRLLCSQRIFNDQDNLWHTFLRYTVPSNSQPYLLSCKRDDLGWCVKVARDGSEKQLDVICPTGQKISFGPNHRDFQSQILHRCIRFLFSARPTTRTEIRAILSPLVRQQREDGLPTGNLTPCRKIDWRSIVARE